MDVVTTRLCLVASMASNLSTVGYEPSTCRDVTQTSPNTNGLLSARWRPRLWACWGALGVVRVQNTPKSVQHHGRDGSSVSSTVSTVRRRPAGAAPALLMVSTHRAMVTTARCTEVAG